MNIKSNTTNKDLPWHNTNTNNVNTLALMYQDFQTSIYQRKGERPTYTHMPPSGPWRYECYILTELVTNNHSHWTLKVNWITYVNQLINQSEIWPSGLSGMLLLGPLLGIRLLEQKCLLSLWRNAIRVSAKVTWSGRLFHTRGPATHMYHYLVQPDWLINWCGQN